MRFYNIIHSLLLAKAEKEHNNLLEMALNCMGLFISLYPLKERLPEKKLLLTTLEIFNFIWEVLKHSHAMCKGT